MKDGGESVSNKFLELANWKTDNIRVPNQLKGVSPRIQDIWWPNLSSTFSEARKGTETKIQGMILTCLEYLLGTRQPEASNQVSDIFEFLHWGLCYRSSIELDESFFRDGENTFLDKCKDLYNGMLTGEVIRTFLPPTLEYLKSHGNGGGGGYKTRIKRDNAR